jgi:hypothetical protein
MRRVKRGVVGEKKSAVSGQWSEVRGQRSLGKNMKKRPFLRSTIYDLRSTICYLLGGENLPGRFGAAGPHRPTGWRDKISRMQRELQRPEIEAKPDWHGRNEVEAIKNPEKNGLLRSAIYDL